MRFARALLLAVLALFVACTNNPYRPGESASNTYFTAFGTAPTKLDPANSYYSHEEAQLLAGFIDLYLLDFKYGNNTCAEEISDAPGYWEACTRNHLTALKYGELLIRVLVLPGHNECCTRPILQWIHDNLGPWTRVNLMFQYRPEWRAR